MIPAKKETYYELIIWLPAQGPMRNIIKAESVTAAIAKAKNKYRGCRVELAPPAAKADLTRSSTSASVMARVRSKRLQQLTDRSENVENG